MVEHGTPNASVGSSILSSGAKQSYGQMGEWLKPTDCKSVPKGALIRIQLCPPNSCSYSITVYYATLIW